MAVTVARANNVIRASGAGTEDLGNINVRSIKYIGSSAGEVRIRKGDTAGTTLYEADGSTDSLDEAKIRVTTNANIEIVSSAVCYIYLH